MSNLVHVADSLICPGIEFHQNRNSFDPKRSLRHFLTMLQDFGHQHCVYSCAYCEKNASFHPKNKELFLQGSRPDLQGCFNISHQAAGQLPDEVYRHLVQLAGGECPVCAILTALNQFPAIAKHSDSTLLTQESQPCFWGYERDETGWSSDVLIRHVDALHGLSIDELPSRLTPSDEYGIRENLKSGKAIVDFIHSFLSGNASVLPSMSDDELWMILHWKKRHDDPALEITDAWETWAKKAFMAGANLWSSDDVCRIIFVAVNCYENLTMLDISIGGFIDGRGIEIDRLLEIFNSVACLCNEEMHDMRSFYNMLEGWKSTFISWDVLTLGEIYISLAIPGKLSAEKLCGKPPPFFQGDVRLQKRDICQKTAMITQSITKNDANATGIGIGTGGKGGNAAVTFEREAVKPVAKIESGAVKMEANPTINNNLPNPADFVREFRGLLDDEYRRRETSAVPPPSDVPVDDDPLPPLGSWVSRADIAAKLERTTDTLKNWENKGKGPGDVVWPKSEGTPNNAYYNFREVWRSFLSLLPDTDRAQKASLIEGLSVIKRP